MGHFPIPHLLATLRLFKVDSALRDQRAMRAMLQINQIVQQEKRQFSPLGYHSAIYITLLTKIAKHWESH